ncbi:MAG: hypothetical protein JKY18_04335 [Flavobacteriales bacterium]|nr:hypothetical protein [Flavobacteriales bacterium]
MNKILIILIFSFAVFCESSAQNIKLRKDCRIDTLRVSLSMASVTNKEMGNRLRTILDSIVEDFNHDETQFKLSIDSTAGRSSLHINLNAIDYVNRKRNLSFTVLNLIFFTGTLYLNSQTGYIIPFLLFPSANIETDVLLSPDLSASGKMTKTYISGNGFWLKHYSQEMRIIDGFENAIHGLFKRIHYRYYRVLRKQIKLEAKRLKREGYKVNVNF